MKPELRLAVPPEVGVPIPLGDAECRNCTNGFVTGLCGPEDCGCDSGRVPVVPTCQTCGGSGRIPFEHEDAEADATEPCPDCTDGVARRWVGTVTVAGGPCPVLWRATVGHSMYGCSGCNGSPTGSLPDRRYRVEGDVVPVSDHAIGSDCIVVCSCGTVDLVTYPNDKGGYDDPYLIQRVTAAFPDGPPAVGTWAVVPETIEETA